MQNTCVHEMHNAFLFREMVDKLHFVPSLFSVYVCLCAVNAIIITISFTVPLSLGY